MNTIDVRNCPICEASPNIVAVGTAKQIVESSPYYSSSFYQKVGISEDTKFRLVRCPNCAFVFTAVVPSPSFLNELYSGSATSDETASIFARPDRAAFAFKSVSVLLQQLSDCVPKNPQGVPDQKIKIIDVGCAFAVGSLGLSFPGYPYELTGVEWSPVARNYLAERGIATYKAVEDLPDGFSAHGIILNDVLEHVANPLMFVQQLKRISTPETVISVNVPNFIDWRMNQILKLVNSGSSCVPKDLNPWEHLSYFSPQSLNLLFSKIGATRVRPSTIELRTGGSGLRQLFSMIIRANRDAIRGFRGTYPDNYTTQGIFQFSDF